MTSRRQSDPTVLYAVLTLICVAGAIAAFIMQRENRARLAAYRSDAHCGSALAAIDTGAAQQRCTVRRTLIASRWKVTGSRRSIDYDLAVIGARGGTDSLSLAVGRDHETWNEAVPGDTAYVERFADPALGERVHVTAIRIRSRPARTAWNPEYRAQGDLVGIVFLGALAPLFAFLTYRSRRRRQAVPGRVITRETYRVTFKIQ